MILRDICADPKFSIQIPKSVQQCPLLGRSDQSLAFSAQRSDFIVATNRATVQSSSPSHPILTLMKLLDSTQFSDRWCNNHVVQKIRLYIRDVVDVLYQMEVGGHKRGYLSSADIALVQGRAEVLVSPKIGPFPEYKQQFKELIIEVLGADTSGKPELASFYKWIDKRKISFELLWTHPLLQSPKERLYMMVEGPLYLDKRFHRKHQEDWGDKYREHYTDVVLIEDVVKGVTGFEDVFYYEGDTWFKDKSEDPNKRYEENDLGVLKFARTAVIHINERLAEAGEKRMEEEEVERMLSLMFPKHVTNLYDFLVHYDIGVKFLFERRDATESVSKPIKRCYVGWLKHTTMIDWVGIQRD